jgi:hypothetical protein
MARAVPVMHEVPQVDPDWLVELKQARDLATSMWVPTMIWSALGVDSGTV